MKIFTISDCSVCPYLLIVTQDKKWLCAHEKRKEGGVIKKEGEIPIWCPLADYDEFRGV